MAKDILNLYDDRRKLKEATKTNPEMKDKRRQISIKIRNLMKKSKETLDTRSKQQHNRRHFKRKSNKKAYKILNILTKSNKRKTMIIIDKNNKRVI